MIILYTKKNVRHRFNVKDEPKVLAAWQAMRGDPKYASKIFKFSYKSEQADVVLNLRVADIKSLLAVTEGAFEPVIEEAHVTS